MKNLDNLFEFILKGADINSFCAISMKKHSTNCLVQMINNPFCFCSVIKCPAVTPPANGLVGACSLNYQGTCSVSCADGYVRHGGDETRTCLVNKRWSGVPPTCRGTWLTLSDAKVHSHQKKAEAKAKIFFYAWNVFLWSFSLSMWMSHYNDKKGFPLGEKLVLDTQQ